MGDIISDFFNGFIFTFIVTVGDIIDTVVGLMRMLLGLDALEGDGSTHNLVLSTLTNPIAYALNRQRYRLYPLPLR